MVCPVSSRSFPRGRRWASPQDTNLEWHYRGKQKSPTTGALRGNGALVLAVGEGIHEMTRLLLEAGADTNALRCDGHSPLSLATSQPNFLRSATLEGHVLPPADLEAFLGAALWNP